MKLNKKKKRKSPAIRWKIFAFMLVPISLLIVLLWITQAAFLGVFYGAVKTQELKNTTNTVIDNLEKNNIQDRILFLSSNGNINIRVVDTSAFESLYTTGEAFDSVTYGLGTYGMWSVYQDAVKNNGEIVRYYSEGEDFEDAFAYDEENKPDFPKPPPEPKTNADGEENDEKINFRRYFERVPRPAIFDNVGKHNDLLYAKIATLSDGSEIIVIADTRISPLDSTVAALRLHLICATVVTVLISLIVSFFIAKHISKPIEKTTKGAKVLAQGDFDAKFDGKGYREIEELNETLNYASRELGKVEELRRELMANVSHDMRTPLTMIVGYGEVMRDLPGENTPENIQVIIDEANRLTSFVNSVLDLSKLQSGMENLEMSEVDITAVLEKTVDRYSRLMAESGLDISLVYDRHINVLCDETKITQALFNLTDNAVNYAKEPKKVVIRQLVPDKNTVRIEISDNGEGINPAELPYIWDRYYKTDKSHKRNTVGSGIGLSIVKEILKKHGAHYGVETKENDGSTFWFELGISE